MINRDQSSLAHTTRPASRRLHRRLPLSIVAPQVPACVANRRLQRTLGLPQSVVREAGMLELVAAQMHIAELEQALREAREAAFTDPLTGALNRRGFVDAFQREFARSARSGASAGGLVLALIDIDNFKRLNDTLGHQAGDEALVHLVRVLRASMRPSDVLSRFGGEEFVLLLPEARLADAQAALCRFQRELAVQMVPGREFSLTFSAGVVVQMPSESMEAAIQRADAATFAAKRAGKNCVVTG